jgi:hypothetical protein
MKKAFWLVLVVCVFLFSGLDMDAQCAMCKATAESATENVDRGIGEGLNNGIIYLMLIPYVLLGTIALVFFRKKIFAAFSAR